VSKRKLTNSTNVIDNEKELILEDNEYSNKILFSNIRKKLKIEFKNKHQEEYCKLIDEKEIIFCEGFAGTGKSFLSIYKALDLLTNPNNKYKNIIIIKPSVEATSNSLGFLPGNLEEKLDPYLYSIYYIFEKIIGKRRVNKLKERQYIITIALQFARGINIDNSIVILEEAQNISIQDLKLFLTRLGENSIYIINGDSTQSDKFRDGKKSGLYFAIDKFKDIDKVGIYKFEKNDIVRNPLINILLEKFENNGF